MVYCMEAVFGKYKDVWEKGSHLKTNDRLVRGSDEAPVSQTPDEASRGATSWKPVPHRGRPSGPLLWLCALE